MESKTKTKTKAEESTDSDIKDSIIECLQELLSNKDQYWRSYCNLVEATSRQEASWANTLRLLDTILSPWTWACLCGYLASLGWLLWAIHQVS